MVAVLARLTLVIIAALSGLAMAPPSQAAAFPAGSVCTATGDSDTRYADIAGHRELWTCDGSGWSIAGERAFVRFELRGDNPSGEELQTRLTRFKAMRLTLIGTRGGVAERIVGEGQMIPATSDWLMRTPLPKLDEPASALVLTVDQPRHAGMLSDARLVPVPAAERTIREELLIAGLCGILCVPLVFNLGFYRVLRERFVLWHALAVVFMLVQTVVTSGLINRFGQFSIATLCELSAWTWGGGIVAAALFSINLIEPGKLDPGHKRLMRGLALWIPAWTMVYLYAGGALRAYAATLYFASYLPVLALFVWVIVVASARRSRAVNFQIAAWLPIMATGTARIATALGWTDAPIEFQLEQHVSICLEVLITSLGVADRFMTIRRQRDRAREQSRVFAALAERDPLTDLLNRRVIEERFAHLHDQGYRTMAVIDLDHFKRVNDNHGHAVGDTVLRATAEALSPDEDTLAVRLGGEEFMLLLRGSDAPLRAERRRQAIATRVAKDVPGLDSIVTASMGLVEHPADGDIHCDFDALYAHCDRLLYEAKFAGRNRTMREKLSNFVRPEGPAAIAG